MATDFAEKPTSLPDEIPYLREELDNIEEILPSYEEGNEKAAIIARQHEVSDEVERYDAVVGGQVKSFEITTLADLPNILIEARRAMGMTRKQLAEAWGLPDEEAQKFKSNQYGSYEANYYGRASLASLVSVSILLDLELKGSLVLDSDTEAD